MHSTTWLARASVFIAEETHNEQFHLKQAFYILEVIHAIKRLALSAEELMPPSEEPGIERSSP